MQVIGKKVIKSKIQSDESVIIREALHVPDLALNLLLITEIS